MGINTLAFWSMVALMARVLAIAILLVVANIQRTELRVRTGLQPFKRRLFALSVVIIVTNVPIIYLHYIRISGQVANEAVTSFATVMNAVGMLIFAILLYMIYQIKLKY